MRVAVTGAAGFVGANLVRGLLLSGAEVHATVRLDSDLWRLEEIRDDIAVHELDLLDPGALERALARIAPQAIVNLATYRPDGSPRERSAALATNVLGAAAVLEAAQACEYERLIHVGSFLEGEQTTFYGFTKASATLLCRQFAREHSRPVVVLRPYTIYGPWQPPDRLVPTAIVAARDGRALTLTDHCRRDWVYVGDVVEACLRAIAVDATAGEVIDIGTGELSTNADVVRAVEHATGRSVETRPGGETRPWDADEAIAPRAKARELLGWTARHGLQDGVAATAEWMGGRMALYRSSS